MKDRSQTKRGPVVRFSCTPLAGESHTFSVLIVEDERLVASFSPPPQCAVHPDSRVVRSGTYGKATAKPRQQYRCHPADGSKPHRFTPALPRDHVHDGEEHCDHCDELRGIHRGETAVARRHTWSTRVVARGLEQLASGGSYADVSQWALRVTGNKRTRRSAKDIARTAAEAAGVEFDEPGWDEAHDSTDAVVDVETGEIRKKRKASAASKASRNSWYIAAGWVEAFAPIVYRAIDERLRAHADAERERLDALIRARKSLERPQVILVDDVPVYGRDLDRSGKARRDAGYYVLVVAELVWPEPSDDPLARPDDPTVKLRLVRAMAKSNTESWRLMFHELGYMPDFIVADAGTGIAAAVRAHFDPKRTKFIPSLWHVANKIELALADIPGATVAGPTGKQLIDPLDKHLRKLSRTSGVLASTPAWSKWWDDLLALLATHRLPSEVIRARRKTYEPAIKTVLPDVRRHPQVPVSTGGLETLIAKHIKPMLAMRRTSFANIERTNRLFDLVVARHHGAFDNLSDVARLLRTDTEANQGWTVALREVADPRPLRGTYSSLRDATLLNSLAKQAGVA